MSERQPADAAARGATTDSLPAFLLAGAVVGVLGVASFGIIHAAIIVPIWSRLAGGIPFALVAGVAMGWALYEVRRGLISRQRADRAVGLAFGGLLWATLVPMTLFTVVLRAAGMHGAEDAWEVVVECVLAAGTGAALGGFIARRRRAALAFGIASLALALTQAGPIPVLNSPRAARLFAGLAVVYVAAGAVLGMLASLLGNLAGSRWPPPDGPSPNSGRA